MVHIIYVNNMPSPYLVARLNELVRRGAKVDAWFGTVRESDRSWEVDEDTWLFHGEYIGCRARDAVRRAVTTRGSRADVLVTSLGDAGLVAAAALGHLVADLVVLRVLASWAAWNPPSWHREMAKHVIYRLADAAKVAGPDGARQAMRYGVPAERVFTVRQSIDAASAVGSAGTSNATGPYRRPSAEGPVFGYAGRLWWGKGIHVLMDAYRIAAARGYEPKLLIAGDGVAEHEVRVFAEAFSGVTYLGYLQPDVLSEFYAGIDVLIFPTLGDPYGLVVDEALAAGIPVISSRAAGEILTRVRHGENGFVTKAGDPADLANSMFAASDPDTLDTLRRGAVMYRVAHSHGLWAHDFLSMVHALKSEPRVGGGDV